jgi:hypothetical protein
MTDGRYKITFETVNLVRFNYDSWRQQYQDGTIFKREPQIYPISLVDAFQNGIFCSYSNYVV